MRRTRSGLACLALVLMIEDASGQLLAQRREQVDMAFQDMLDMAVTDLDRDGDSDLVLARSAQSALILYNQQGVLSASVLDRRQLRSSAVAAGDVNGDRIPDIVLGTHWNVFNAGRTELYLGLASGGFKNVTAAKMPVDRGEATMDLALADVDRDGDLDLVVANRGQSRLYLNSGGSFSDQTSTRMPPLGAATNAVAVADIDGDKDLDLVIANGGLQYGQQNRIYLNDGKGRFTDATSRLLPASSAYTRAVAVGDVDRDGKADIVFGGSSANGAAARDVLLVQRQGRFVDVSSARFPNHRHVTNDVVLVDVNGDSYLDLVGTGDSEQAILSGLWLPSTWVYLNDGKGTLTMKSSAVLPAPYRRSTVGRPVHIDGDGKIDLVVSGRGELDLYHGNGKGQFRSATLVSMLPNLNIVVGDTAVGDVDRDGELDILIGTHSQNLLFFGRGDGTYTDETKRLPADLDWTSSVLLRDLDRDVDLDILVGNTAKNRLYLNNGRGQFVDATSMLPTTARDTMALAVVDVDGDGRDDIVEANSVRDGVRLYWNNGKGQFVDQTSSRLPSLRGDAASVLAIDIDGDGDQDLIIGNGIPTRVGGDRQDVVLVNDGKGRFLDETAKRMPVDRRNHTISLATADIDADGDLDVMRGVWNDGTNPGGVPEKLLINDGKGHFKFDVTRFVAGLLFRWMESVGFADVDGDGAPDIVSPIAAVYVNDGKGYFREIWGFPTNVSGGWGRMGSPIASDDFDGDGDLDLLLSTTLFSNQTIGVRIPTWPRVGGRLRVDMAQWPWSHAPGPGIGLLYMQAGGTGTRQSVGYPGLLRLDPRRLVLSGVHAVGKPTPADFPVPNDVRLRGTRVGVQALMWNPRSRWQLGLTNVDWTSIR